MTGGTGFLAQIEAREKERTGIRTLKVGYNKVFGYYIEVSNSFKDQVPEDYIRKQTLVNCRAVHHPGAQGAGARRSSPPRTGWWPWSTSSSGQLRQDIAAAGRAHPGHRRRRGGAGRPVLPGRRGGAATTTAAPTVDDSGVIEIHDGRHPVVERMLKDGLFVPNDTYMGEKENRVAIITGPNMAGKSTYMRQVALIVLMAQMGSFVPAALRPHRRGGPDLHPHRRQRRPGRRPVHLHGGDDRGQRRSSATPPASSLLILDEIGRGTSTFDGMSIARAVLEYCADPKKLGAKTLFATHYHELTELESSLPGGEELQHRRQDPGGGHHLPAARSSPAGPTAATASRWPSWRACRTRWCSRARTVLEELEAGDRRPAPAAPATRQRTR